MCGGEDSYHLVKLHQDEASKDKRFHPFDVMYDTKRAIFKSELHFATDHMPDKIFHVSLIPRFFIWPPFLVLHEAGHELRLTRKLLRDKNVHFSMIPGTDVEPPSLVFHKTGLASVEGVKVTKVIPVIAEPGQVPRMTLATALRSMSGRVYAGKSRQELPDLQRNVVGRQAAAAEEAGPRPSPLHFRDQGSTSSIHDNTSSTRKRARGGGKIW